MLSPKTKKTVFENLKMVVGESSFRGFQKNNQFVVRNAAGD